MRQFDIHLTSVHFDLVASLLTEQTAFAKYICLSLVGHSEANPG